MSAMHWEARRRRSALDRRTARDNPQLLNGGSDSVCKTTAPNAPQQPAAVQRCPHCQGDLTTAGQQSAKIPNRYSSLQYKQQW